MDSQTIHDLAIAYAQSKLLELQISSREAPLQGNIDFSSDEVRYLQSAYLFAIERLSE